MARWTSRTLLPPDWWAEIVGFKPCSWNGVKVEAERGCEMWYQRPWQADPMRAGRDTMGQAVLQAENKMASRLGFFLAPRYVEAERAQWPDYSCTVKTRHGHVIEIGQEARDMIEESAPVLYSDADGDGIVDTATVSVIVPAAIDPCEIAVYYPGMVSPTAITDNDETWRIMLKSLSVVGTIATMTFHRCQAVRWSLHDEGEIIDDITDNAFFIGAVDVYRRYTVPTGCEAVTSDAADCKPGCAEVTQDLCGFIRNAELGHVRLSMANYSAGAWSTGSWPYTSGPQFARLAYLSGWRDPGLDDCDRWGDLEDVVAQLSLTFLRENVCQCPQFKWLWESARQSLEVGTPDLASTFNLFGSTMLGAFSAYVWCREHALSRGGSVT